MQTISLKPTKNNIQHIARSFPLCTVLYVAGEKQKKAKANIDNVRRSYANVSSVAVSESFAGKFNFPPMAG